MQLHKCAFDLRCVHAIHAGMLGECKKTEKR